MKKVLILLAVFGTAATSLAPPCFFNFAGCERESCGINCTIVSYGPITYNCYTNGSLCCLCIGWDITCECTFGEGTGHQSEWRVADNAECGSVNDGKCRDLQTGQVVWGTLISSG